MTIQENVWCCLLFRDVTSFRSFYHGTMWKLHPLYPSLIFHSCLIFHSYVTSRLPEGTHRFTDHFPHLLPRRKHRVLKLKNPPNSWFAQTADGRFIDSYGSILNIIDTCSLFPSSWSHHVKNLQFFQVQPLILAEISAWMLWFSENSKSPSPGTKSIPVPINSYGIQKVYCTPSGCASQES